MRKAIVLILVLASVCLFAASPAAARIWTCDDDLIKASDGSVYHVTPLRNLPQISWTYPQPWHHPIVLTAEVCKSGFGATWLGLEPQPANGGIIVRYSNTSLLLSCDFPELVATYTNIVGPAPYNAKSRYACAKNGDKQFYIQNDCSHISPSLGSDDFYDFSAVATKTVTFEASINWGPRPVVPYSVTLCATNSTTQCSLGDPEPRRRGFCEGTAFAGATPYALLHGMSNTTEGVRFYYTPNDFGLSAYIEVLCDPTATALPFEGVSISHEGPNLRHVVVKARSAMGCLRKGRKLAQG